MSLTLLPYFLAMLLKVSPERTLWYRSVVTLAVAVAVGVAVT